MLCSNYNYYISTYLFYTPSGEALYTPLHPPWVSIYPTTSSNSLSSTHVSKDDGSTSSTMRIKDFLNHDRGQYISSITNRAPVILLEM